MPSPRTQFAAVAAVLAVQLGLPPSTASETVNDSFDKLADAFSAPSFPSNDSLWDFEMPLMRSMSSLLSLLSPMRSMSPAGGVSVSLGLSEDDPKG